MSLEYINITILSRTQWFIGSRVYDFDTVLSPSDQLLESCISYGRYTRTWNIFYNIIK